MVNSLLYEICNHKNNDALFRLLMEEARFPFVDSPSLDGKLNIIIESSLSGFGAPDVVVLINSGNTKSTIFIEAKVAAQTKNWSLRAHFTDFKECANGRKQNRKKKIMKVDSSNLFAQIYHKQKFILAPTFDALESGVSFPEWSSNKCRKIGNNPVVHRIAKRIRRHRDSVFYLMLIPDNSGDESLESFCKEELRDSELPETPEWDTSHYGFLTWKKVEGFCRKKNLPNTLAIFDYNGDQIYKKICKKK